jgi:hypothetical protein
MSAPSSPRSPPPGSPASPRSPGFLNRSNSFPTPISTQRQSEGESYDAVGPLAPSPLILAGYLRKLKSEEGAFSGIFQRSKFNKRWFEIQEKDGGGYGAGIGHLYELKYWKVSSEVSTKLPGFILDFDAILGCEEGVGLGPFTREPFTFHIETQQRTYVLTAASREEMMWWIKGVKYYAWQHQQTKAKIMRREAGVASPQPPATGVVQAQTRDAFGSNPNRRKSLPLADLGSPASSSDGSSIGGGSPLPSFSPMSPLDATMGPSERVVVQLTDYESTGKTPRAEVERKYEGGGGGGEKEEQKYPHAPPASSPALFSNLSKPPAPGELSSPIRFGHADIVTARVQGELSSPIRLGLESERGKGETPGKGQESTRSNGNGKATQRSEDDPFGAHGSGRSAAAYPSLSSRSVAPDGAPSNRSIPEELLSPHEKILNDASAPPQTERPGVQTGRLAESPLPIPLAAKQHPSTNPHLSSDALRLSQGFLPSGRAPLDSMRSPPATLDSPHHTDLGATGAGFEVQRMQGGDTEREEEEEEEGEDPFGAHGSDRAKGAPNQVDSDIDADENLLSTLASPDSPSSVRGKDDPLLADSLDAADESIMNGSMLEESFLGDKEIKQMKMEIPALRANITGGTAGVKSKLPPLTNLAVASSTSSNPTPATPFEVAAVVAAPPAPVAPSVRSQFTPSHTATCNTRSDFRTLRNEVVSYGLDRLIADQVAAGWFVHSTDGSSGVKISDGPKPFNPFARLVTGQLPAPYGNLLSSHGLSSFDSKFFVAQNKPELNAQWSSADPEWVGKASMAKNHQFLLLRSLAWQTFNIATFGLDASPGAQAASQRMANLQAAISLLDEMAECARRYTAAAGWSTNLGLFFHAYPFNSVHALHLHMCDMDTIGPTFHHLNHKNLPISEARAVLLEELHSLGGDVPSRVLLTLDYPFLSASSDSSFKSNLAAEVATSLGVAAARVRVTNIQAGSVIATVEIQQNGVKGELSAEELLQQLTLQVKEPNSQLRRGKLGGKVTKMQVVESSASGAAPIEIAAVVAAPAAPAIPAPRSQFTPSHTATCNTRSDFRTLRNEVVSYGLDRLIADQVAAGWFVHSTDGSSGVKISDGPKPFNPFARLVTGQLPAPYGNLLSSHGLSSFDSKFFVAQNKPELNAQWSSADPEWVGKASMAKNHQFLLLRSLAWQTFNIATFGLDASPGAQAASQRMANLQAAISLLDEMAECARRYTAAAGWSTNLGLFFHAYPFNSVHALHLHMCDMDTIGPTFHHLNHKNLPISEARAVLLEELHSLGGSLPTSVKPIAALISLALPPSPAPSSAWQTELSSLLNSEKLPYEDFPTQRGTGPPQQIVEQKQSARKVETPKPVAATAVPTPVAAAAVTPAAPPSIALSQCDSCYVSITSSSLPSSTYCWTCQQVFCARCTPTHAVSNRNVQHAQEPLATYVEDVQQAYCTQHAMPPMKLGKDVKLESGFTVTSGIRPRSLRYTGLFDTWCATCSKLLCPQCKSDGKHSAHQIMSIAMAAGKKQAEIGSVVQGRVGAKKLALQSSLSSSEAALKQLTQEGDLIRSETKSAAQSAMQPVHAARDQVVYQAQQVRLGLSEQLRRIEGLELAIASFQPTPSIHALPPSSAASIALLISAAGLQETALSLAGPAPVNDAVPAVAFEMKQAQEKIVAARREKEEQVKASVEGTVCGCTSGYWSTC